MSSTHPEPHPDGTPTANMSLPSTSHTKVKYHLPPIPHSEQPPPPHNYPPESTTQTHSEVASAPGEYKQAPTKALKSQQPAPTTQPAEPTDPSQVAGSIPKPPNWNTMTSNQKKNWLQHHTTVSKT